MISFISPRRYGKTTFALKRYHMLRHKDEASFFKWGFICPSPEIVDVNISKYRKMFRGKYRDDKVYALRLIGPKSQRLDFGIISPATFLEHRQYYKESGYQWVIDDIELTLPLLLGDANTSVDTITGTLQRVNVGSRPAWLEEKWAELRNTMSKEAFNREYLCEFKEGE